MSTHNFGFRSLVFYHREQWRGAKTAGKKCWGPCHGLIPSSWDFAQNYSLQIETAESELERHILFTRSLDSEKAIELCISNVEKARYAEFNVSKCAHPLKPPIGSLVIADKKAKNSRRRIPEQYPMIPKTPKVQKVKGHLKCWMVARVNRGLDSYSCGKIAVWQLCNDR